MTIDRDLPRVLSTGEARRIGFTRVGLSARGRGAALSGLDVVRLADPKAKLAAETSHVLVLTPHGHNRLIGQSRVRVTRRRYAIRSIWDDDGRLPLAGVARAITDAALVGTSLREVRALVTGCVQRGTVEVDDLIAELASCPRNGSGFLRRALEDVLHGAASVAEAQAINELRLAPVPAFELNVPLLRPDGSILAVADVFWRALRAVLEVDSREYHFSEAEWNDTMTRHNKLTAAGLAVTHYSPSRIASGALRSAVAPWLRARATELGVAYAADPRSLRPASGTPAPSFLR